ncbi:MAG: DUF3343 domain-containing protein [Clostridia bacterium]|nr:DUF3343 domain-containing protein [Clostridia bacterium]
MNCIITLPSMTHAQNARERLLAHGIASGVIRLPQGLSQEGCAWGISLDCRHADEGQKVLSLSNLPFRKVIRGGD